MCAVGDRVTNADLPTSQAISCGRAYHVRPLFLVLERESQRLDLHNDIFYSDPGKRM